MLFFHILLTNYDEGREHPILDAIGHWLMCLVLTIVSSAAVGALFVLAVLLLSIALE